MTSSIQSWTWTSETERSAISHWPIVLSPLHGAMPVVVPPKVARLDIHTRPAHQQVFGFGGVVFDLGNRTANCTGRLLCAYKRRGKYTYQPANDDGQRY